VEAHKVVRHQGCPHFLGNQLTDGGEVVSLMQQLTFTLRKTLKRIEKKENCNLHKFIDSISIIHCGSRYNDMGMSYPYLNIFYIQMIQTYVVIL
jgi:uncharacterized protein YllA (UPF0747 family)